MRWWLFLILVLGAVWAGVVAAQRQLAGLPLAPSPRSVIMSLRQAITPRLTSQSTVVTTKSSTVPILMYHHIQALPDSQVGTVDWGLSIPPTNFEQQLVWLKDHGYESESLADALAGHRPSKPVVLTFDDGYADFYTQAWPLLMKYGFSGTIYIITNRLGSAGFLTTDQLVTLANAGVEVGSHTVSHPNLSTMSGAKLTKELADSRNELRRLTGQAVASFCYPSGRYTEVTVSAVKAAGYQTAVTTKEGLANLADTLTLSRLRIKPSLTIDGFAALLSGQSK